MFTKGRGLSLCRSYKCAGKSLCCVSEEQERFFFFLTNKDTVAVCIYLSAYFYTSRVT